MRIMTIEEKIIQALENGEVTIEDLQVAAEVKVPIPDFLLDGIDGGLGVYTSVLELISSVVKTQNDTVKSMGQ